MRAGALPPLLQRLYLEELVSQTLKHFAIEMTRSAVFPDKLGIIWVITVWPAPAYSFAFTQFLFNPVIM